MFREEEKKIMDIKKDYKNIDIPENIDDFIINGIKDGKKYKRKKIRKSMIGYAACMLLVGLLVSIRISPTFADMMSNIPGVQYIVNLINYDKGLQLAVENNFIQHVGVSDEHENVVFTVEDIIVDESRMVVFYSIENKGNYERLTLTDVKFLDEEGKHLVASYGFDYHTSGENDEVNKFRDKVDVSFASNIAIPDTVKMQVKIKEYSKLTKTAPIRIDKGKNKGEEGRTFKSTWEVTIPIDKEKFQDLKETYPINKEIVIENQKVYFEQLVQYPTKIAVDIEYDEKNTMKIFGFENIRIGDENTEWTTPNGVTASYINENTVRLYFQSNFFSRPNELYIVADGIRALSKDQLKVKVDLEEQKILNPPDEKLKLKGINTRYTNDVIEIIFEVNMSDVSRVFGIFNYSFEDEEGNEFNSVGIGTSTNDEDKAVIFYEIERNQDYKNPLVLEICDYPSIIEKKINIKVK